MITSIGGKLLRDKAYNPLHKENLGKSVAEALLTTPVRSFDEVKALVGAGVYAIYYTGSSEFYSPIAESNLNGNFEQPIYVGKAIPEGGRKGGVSFDAEKGRALRERLTNHAKSIIEAENLDIRDFGFRCLVVDDIWIPLGENMLIERLRPVWNLVIDGFGNKDPGRRRAEQYRSPWDILHPGRKFAEKLAIGPTTLNMLVERLNRFYEQGVVVHTPKEAMVLEEEEQE